MEGFCSFKSGDKETDKDAERVEGVDLMASKVERKRQRKKERKKKRVRKSKRKRV